MKKNLAVVLPALLLFSLLGFSVTANAAKPDKQHVLTTPPVRGVTVTCSASNLTPEPLEVYFDLPNQGGDISQGLSTIPAGEVIGWMQTNSMNWSWTYCTLSWFGQKEDVKGTICVLGPSPTLYPQVCLSAD